MDTLMIFGTQFFMSIIVFALIAWWYVAPWMAERPTSHTLAVLILPHAFRHIGLTFMVPGVVAAPLPGDVAEIAGYGDLASTFLAIAALVALRARWGIALALVWVFNIVGAVDLINALRLAPSAAPNLGAMWFIPTFLVPLLLVTHFLIFVQLLRREPLSASKLS